MTITRTVLVGSAKYSLGPGGSRTLKIRLTKAAVRALAAARRHRLKTTALATGQAPQTLTLVPAKQKKHHKRRKKK